MKRSYSPKEILSILLPALFSFAEAGAFSYCNGHLLPLSLRTLAVLPCAALLYYCTKQLIKTCRSYNKAEWISSAVLALILSIIIIYCNAVYYNDWLFFEPVHCYKSLLIFPGILVIFLTLMHLKLKDIPYPKATEFALEKRFPYAVYGSVFLSFLICLISHFPGHFGYDAVFQYEQYINHAITTHHPLLHTLLLCGLVRFGETIFSSAAAGLLIYTVVQMGVLTYALGKGILFVQKQAGNWAYIVWAPVLFLPYHAILSISATKDVLFGAFFLLYAICLYEGIETREVWQSRVYCLRFILLTFLVCAFRNNGIYVVIATLPFLFLILKNQLREVLVSSGIALVLYVLLTGPISGMIGVSKGPIHEMLSVPIQQLAVTYSQPWDANLTQEEKDWIYRYMPNVDYVTKRSADIVKNDFNDDLFLEDPMRFFRLYLSVGSRNPQLYLNAYTNLHMGFYNPEMVWPNPESFHPFLEWTLSEDDPRLDSTKYLQIPTQTLSWRLSAYYERYANENTFMKYPLLQHLSSIGVYTWAMLLGLLISLFRKKWGCVLVLLMSFFYFGTCILGPVVLFRYAYAYILTVTVFLPLIFHNTDKAR